ncbi:hypothetical protein J6590_040733 [Homalodisca vitripennis]|nr:hypothetical protein J6590_040733 [Homalodisca vitripennis]
MGELFASENNLRHPSVGGGVGAHPVLTGDTPQAVFLMGVMRGLEIFVMIGTEIHDRKFVLVKTSRCVALARRGGLDNTVLDSVLVDSDTILAL